MKGLTRTFAATTFGLFAITANAGDQAAVQAALDQLYPGWTASNVGDVTGHGNRDCGLHDGVIAVHPLDRKTPATLARTVTVEGTHPVLHLRVSSAADGRDGDWVLRVRVNGRPVAEDVVIASTAVRDFKCPLAVWTNRGPVKIELDTAAGGDHDWRWETGFWHLIEIVDDASAYAAGERPAEGATTILTHARARPLKGPAMKDIRIGGRVGEMFDRHIANGMLTKDVDAYAAVFDRRALDKKGPWAGEFWGKWMMTAVPAQAYSGNAELKEKIERTLNYVLENQYDDGYIGDLSKDRRFGTEDWDIWCRKYTLLGLIAHHCETGDKRSLRAACRLADNLMEDVGPGKIDIVLTGPHRGYASSGVLQAFCRLATLTGERKYRDYANYIANQLECGPKAAHLFSTILTGREIANITRYSGRMMAWENTTKSFEMSVSYIGLLDLYRICGAPEHLMTACFAADSIARSEMTIIGAANSHEQWCGHASRQTEAFIHANEGCTKVMWMHFCRELLETTGEARWADEFERSLFNAYLAGYSPDCSRYQMYQPMLGRRGEGPMRNQSGIVTHCCNELCPHGFIDLLNSVVMTDGRDAFVAQYIPGRATVELEGAGKVEIVQETDYPVTGKIRLTVNPERPGRFALNVRVPGWSAGGRPSWRPYVRDWKRGDTLEVEWPITVVTHRQNGHVAFTAGPIVLARDTRYNDGDISEPIELRRGKKPTCFKLDPNPHPGRWISYVAEEMGYWDGHGAYEGVSLTREIRFCDFLSAANTWDDTTRCRVWCPAAHYRPAD